MLFRSVRRSARSRTSSGAGRVTPIRPLYCSHAFPPSTPPLAPLPLGPVWNVVSTLNTLVKVTGHRPSFSFPPANHYWPVRYTRNKNTPVFIYTDSKRGLKSKPLPPLPPAQNPTVTLPHRPTNPAAQPPTFSQAFVCHCFRSLHNRDQDAKKRRTETLEPPHARARQFVCSSIATRGA